MSGHVTIPADFPREVTASITGAQPKLPVRFDSESGKYVSGYSPEELAERFDLCEDLANQVVEKCRRKRSTKYEAMTEEGILSSLLNKLLLTGWGSDEEMRWVIRRVAFSLDWPVPNAAKGASEPR